MPISDEERFRMAEVKSSNIHSVGHDPLTRTLRVTFKDKAGKPAGTYDYPDIGTDKHAEFMKSDSIGSYHSRVFKPLAAKKVKL